MRRAVYLLLVLFVFLTSLDAQSRDSKKAKVHPAVTTAVTWAEAVKNGTVKPENDLLDQAARITVNNDKGGFLGVFDREFSQLLLKEKAKLTFQPIPDNPNSGNLTLDGKPGIPMYRKDERWYLDLEKLLDSIKLNAQLSQADTEIFGFKTRLEQYRMRAGHYPSVEQGLMALFKKPTTKPRPRRWVQLIQKVEELNDPWGNPYRYQFVDGKPVITSLGPDGIVSKDDISVEE